MAQTPSVYRWDDEGAPQAGDCTFSELVNIIDKCLVTGYGDKPPLGWVKELNDPVACSYKNLGSGHSVVFSSSTGLDDAVGVRVQSARNVIDADNLENRGWKQAFTVFKDKNIAWVILGTDKAFYCFFCYQGSYKMPTWVYQTGFFVGDLSNAISGDDAKFIAVCSFISENFNYIVNPTNAWGTNIQHLNFNTTSPYKALKIYDTDGSLEHGLYYPHKLSFIDQKPTPTLSVIPSNTLEKIYLFHQDYATALDRESKPIIESYTRPAVRGHFPGLYSTLVGHPENMIWPATVNYGDNYLLLKHVNNCANRMVINLEVWDD